MPDKYRDDDYLHDRFGRAAPLVVILRSPWSVAALVSGLLLAAVYLAWATYGQQVLDHPRYNLSADKIEISPTPAWIKTDIKAEVVRDNSLEQLKIHDRQLLPKLTDAFAVHSWVEEVTQIRKLASLTIQVQLKYRRPVAMVEVQTDRGGLLPIDAAGVVLPTKDFNPDVDGEKGVDPQELAAFEQRIRPYPRITVPDAKSHSVEGTAWGDSRVHAAAAIAAAWGDNWSKVGLYRISLLATDPTRRMTASFQLLARGGARVIWGTAPGQEQPGEAKAEEKIAQLLNYTQLHGPLDSADPELVLDIRLGRVRVTAQPDPAAAQPIQR